MLVFTLGRDSAESIGAAEETILVGVRSGSSRERHQHCSENKSERDNAATPSQDGEKLSSVEGGVLRDEWVWLLVSPPCQWHVLH